MEPYLTVFLEKKSQKVFLKLWKVYDYDQIDELERNLNQIKESFTENKTLFTSVNSDLS